MPRRPKTPGGFLGRASPRAGTGAAVAEARAGGTGRSAVTGAMKTKWTVRTVRQRRLGGSVR